MKKFDTQVQYLKYKVLREVARKAWDDTLYDKLLDIPKIIIPGPEPTTRCCIYKERAIVEERMKLAMGGDKNNPNVIEVMMYVEDALPIVVKMPVKGMPFISIIIKKLILIKQNV